MTRPDGFFIAAVPNSTGSTSETAFIPDSQGPAYANSGRLGKSLHAMTWGNPCECADVSDEIACDLYGARSPALAPNVLFGQGGDLGQ